MAKGGARQGDGAARGGARDGPSSAVCSTGRDSSRVAGGLSGSRLQGRVLKGASRPQSRFRGVHYNHGRWAASIKHVGRSIHLGLHESDVQAARIYDRACIRLGRAYAELNFPRHDYAGEPAGGLDELRAGLHLRRPPTRTAAAAAAAESVVSAAAAPGSAAFLGKTWSDPRGRAGHSATRGPVLSSTLSASSSSMRWGSLVHDKLAAQTRGDFEAPGHAAVGHRGGPRPKSQVQRRPHLRNPSLDIDARAQDKGMGGIRGGNEEEEEEDEDEEVVAAAEVGVTEDEEEDEDGDGFGEDHRMTSVSAAEGRGWDPRLHAQIMDAIGAADGVHDTSSQSGDGEWSRPASPLLVFLGGGGAGAGARDPGAPANSQTNSPSIMPLPVLGRLPSVGGGVGGGMHGLDAPPTSSGLAAALELAQAAYWSGSLSPVTFEMDRTFGGYLELPTGQPADLIPPDVPPAVSDASLEPGGGGKEP